MKLRASGTGYGQPPQRGRVRGDAIVAGLLVGGILGLFVYFDAHLKLHCYSLLESPPLDACACVEGLTLLALVILIALVRNCGPSNLSLAAVLGLVAVIELFIDACRFILWLLEPEHQVPARASRSRNRASVPRDCGGPSRDRPACAVVMPAHDQKGYPPMNTRKTVSLSVLMAVALLLVTATIATAQIPDSVFLPFVDSSGTSETGAASAEASARAAPAGIDEVASSILYVKHDATGANDGSSWTDAYTDLQDALAAATAGDEIWVAQGVYVPGTDPDDTFPLVDGVTLYGGFAGTPGSEGDDTGRDWETYVTVLSGDIDGDDTTDANGVVTDPDNIIGTNSRNVITGLGLSSSTVVSGFFITGGNCTCPPGELCMVVSGGGMHSSGDPVLVDLTFSGNAASTAGGFFCYAGEPFLTRVNFVGNAAGGGGGFSMQTGGHPTLVDVSFTDNRAENGGGMSLSSSDATLTNVTFSGNAATRRPESWPGEGGKGGGMYLGGGSYTLRNVTFGSNSAEYGGAIWHEGSLVFLGDSTL